MLTIGIIPARYGSSRFPGKPLVDIEGKSMIQRVYERASAAKGLNEVYVATDDKRIVEHVKSFGGNVVLTSQKHLTGTDRCLEALQKIKTKYDVMVNIQGDEPFIDPVDIDALVRYFKQPDTQIATLGRKINSTQELFNPNKVKLMFNKKGEALYFSRTPVPYLKTVEISKWVQSHDFYAHIGIYAFRTDVLKAISALKPSALEKAESLEQLRWLENGFQIKVATTLKESHAVDTPQDLEELLRSINSQYLD